MGFMFFHKPPRPHGPPPMTSVGLGQKKGPPLHKIIGFEKEQMEPFLKSKEQLNATIMVYRKQYDDLSKTYYQSIFKNDSAEKSQTLQQLNKISNLIFEANLKHFKETKAICTPEQLPKFEKHMKKMFTRPKPRKY